MLEITNLVIIADASGSMCEAGKHMLMRNLLAYIRQKFGFRSDNSAADSIKLLSWGSRTMVVPLNYDSDIPAMNLCGKAAARDLLPLLNDALADAKQPRVLLLSDGQLPRSEIDCMLAWRQTIPHLSLRAIAIGSDADLAALGRLAGQEAVFSAEEIVSALDPWPVSPANPFLSASMPVISGGQKEAGG